MDGNLLEPPGSAEAAGGGRGDVDTRRHVHARAGRDRLPRRPRHSGTLAVEKSNDEFGFGVELSWVADREDVDGASPYGAIDGEDYFVTRVYGQTHLGERTILFGRIENLFDEEYSEADGYPALGLGFYGGARYSF